MHIRSILLGILFAISSVANAQTFAEWDNVNIWELNRERAHDLTLPTNNDALPTEGWQTVSSCVLPESSPWHLSLNGTWKFKWVGTPTSASNTFMNDNFNASAWDDIEVPMPWQVYAIRKGKTWDKPLYINTRYPFTYTSDYSVMADRSSDTYTYSGTMKNPVGSYRRDFELPDTWDGRDIYVRFNGAGHGYYVWVNGSFVGYAEDSYLPSDFKITDKVRPGKNNISVRVYRFTSGSFLECQDYWRLTGITRDVFLWAAPKNQIRDFFFRTTSLSTDGTSATAALDVTTTGSDLKGMKVVATLSDGQEKCCIEKTLTGAGTVTLNMTDLTDIQPWSAETPHLYNLTVELMRDAERIDQRCTRVGLRTIGVRKDGALLINGHRVVFHGVDRHDFSPEGGRTVTREEMENDIRQMKRLNINAIRTSHYPNNPYLYDLCDEYGMYVLAEADVECHGNTGLSSVERFRQPMVQRNVRHVLTLRNHTSICLWSYGNESGGGNNFQTCNDSIKRYDTTRLTHYEGNSTWADVTSTMYGSLRDIENRLKSNLNDYKAGRSVRPHVQCENTHAMGNSMGNQREYYDLYEQYPSSAGEFIWDWRDQGLRTKNPSGKDYFAYGGDFGDKPNDADFCCNGVVLADGTFTSKTYNVKKIYQPVDFYRNTNGEYMAKSKLAHRSTSHLDFYCSLLEDGIVVQTASLGALDIAAGDSLMLNPTFPYERQASKQYAVRFSAKQRNATWWAEAGYEVASEQIEEPAKPERPVYVNTSKEKIQIASTSTTTTIKAGNYTLTFTKGQLATYKMGTRSIISKPISLNAFRLPTSNDKAMDGIWDSYGLRALTLTAGTPEITMADDSTSLTLRIENKYKGTSNALFTVNTCYHIYSDGAVHASHVINPSMTGMQLPRLGVKMEMAKAFDTFHWYGRGPWDSYRDRKESAFPAVHKSTVAEQWADYVLPQETGNKEDVRWLSLTDTAGVGLLFVAPEHTVAASVGNWRPADNYTNRNSRMRHPYEVKRATTTIVNIDAYQRALGNASCGSDVISKYQVPANRTYLSYMILPLDGKLTNQGLAERADFSAPVAPYVQIVRDEEGYAVLHTDGGKATIQYSINGGEPQVYTERIDMRDGGFLEAWSVGEGLMESMHNSLNFPLYVDKSQWSVYSYDSQQGGSEAVGNVIDGNANTIWHTSYGADKTDCPHEVIIDLKQSYRIEAFIYQGREDGGNGRVADYDVYVSSTPKVWGEAAATGRFENNSSCQTAYFPKNHVGRYVRFVIRSTHDNNMYASVAEIDVMAVAREEAQNVPTSVIPSTTVYYCIQHIPSGLFLHYSANANEGDYCLGELNADNVSDYGYHFKFAAVKGFASLYTVKGRKPASFWGMRSNGWAMEATSTATSRNQWFMVEQLDDESVKLRCAGRYSRALNFDATTVGSYVYLDKSTGALFRIYKQSELATQLSAVKKAEGKAQGSVYTLDGIQHEQMQDGINILPDGTKVLINE